MIEAIEFIFRTLKKFIQVMNSTSSPVSGVSLGSLYFGLVFAGIVSYVLLVRIFRGEKNE